MLCAYCGRPAATLVWVGGAGYHEECTRGPGFQAPTYQPLPPVFGCAPLKALTEEDVRRIVREELERNVVASAIAPLFRRDGAGD